LRQLQKIHSSIKNHFVGERQKKYDLDKIFNDVLKLTMPLSYEFKDGVDSKYALQELGMSDLARTERQMKQFLEKKQGEESYRIEFMKKYQLMNEGYIYFHSIGEYIMGYDDFDVKMFEEEVSRNSKYAIIDLPEHMRLFEDLKYLKCYELSDEEYVAKTDKLYKGAKEGLYPLYHYPSIFHFLVRLGNPIGFNKMILKNELKKGIELQTKNNPIYDKLLDRSFTFSNSDGDSDILEELANYAIDLNLKNAVVGENKLSEELFTEFQLAPLMFLEKYSETERIYDYSPIFQKFDAEKTFSCLYSQMNIAISEFKVFLRHRHRHKHSELEPEINFLEGLKKYIEGYSFSEKAPVKKALFHLLSDEINIILTRYV